MAAALGHKSQNKAPIQSTGSRASTREPPGIHALWLLTHYHYLDNALVAQRPLIFSRYAGLGSHRYPVGFSGDRVVSWKSLDFQPEFTATTSNIGHGWWSHDIGERMFGSRDDELVTRWVQLGVFSPIIRLHSSNSRWHINIRASTENEPLVQPMYWEHPALDQAYKVPRRYTFGTQLFVCPITKPRNSSTGLSSVRAWFSPGATRYVGIFTGLVYDGGRELEVFRPLYKMPLFAREGSIIPLDAAVIPENGGQNITAYEILFVVGQNGQFDLLESAEDDAVRAITPSPVSGTFS
ncbi:Neutral alpha-glucosidase C like protein [Verticillium longisporum]|uniref:alpha-glucosidase n=1 Tax=Verticillium longisporum TaxID=100787 RepID=A0A8I2ZTW0_VERLO|nr:Neutral alpha-glucosidase C like protein [Verticillium longisporum]